MHLDCTPAAGMGTTSRSRSHKNNAGYSVTADKLSKFVALSACTISTTQVLFAQWDRSSRSRRRAWAVSGDWSVGGHVEC